jgi:hypothetical protein
MALKPGKITFMLSKLFFFPWFFIFILLLPWACSNSGGAGKPEGFQEITLITPTVTVPPTPSSEAPAAVAEMATPTDTPEPLEYIVEEAKGSVLLIQKGKAEPVTLEEEEEVQEGDEIITRENSQATLSLDENTLIRLGPDSDLRLTALQPNESNGFISRMELVGGKILSEVENLAASHSTFEVNAGGVVCGVRGTEFEVQKQGQEVHTDTFKGQVEMAKGGIKRMVKANQHLAFSFRKKSFQGRRALNAQEKGRFQSWVAQKNHFQERVRSRQAMRESLNRMPLEQRSKILQRMKQAPARQRFKVLKREVSQKGERKEKQKIQRQVGKKPAHPSGPAQKTKPGKKEARFKHPQPAPHPKIAKPAPRSKPNSANHKQPPKKGKNQKKKKQKEDQ